MEHELLNGSSMLDRLAAVVLASLGVGLTACDAEELPVAQTFVNGIAADTEGGAFRVVLHSESGNLEVGSNQLDVRVGFHLPDDPTDPGKGIPGAAVRVSAWMPHDEGALEPLSAVYQGDGIYRVERLELEQPGIWQLDIDIDVGKTMRENVSFAFIVEGSVNSAP